MIRYVKLTKPLSDAEKFYRIDKSDEVCTVISLKTKKSHEVPKEQVVYDNECIIFTLKMQKMIAQKKLKRDLRRR